MWLRFINHSFVVVHQIIKILTSGFELFIIDDLFLSLDKHFFLRLINLVFGQKLFNADCIDFRMELQCKDVVIYNESLVVTVLVIVYFFSTFRNREEILMVLEYSDFGRQPLQERML